MSKLKSACATFKRIYFAVDYYFSILFIGLLFAFALTLPNYLEVTYGSEDYIRMFGKLHGVDFIDYLGSIIGAFVTIFGIILTLNHNQRMVKEKILKTDEINEIQLKKTDEINKTNIRQNQEKLNEERRLSVLPLIVISILYKKAYSISFDELLGTDKPYSTDLSLDNNKADALQFTALEEEGLVITFDEEGIKLATNLSKQQISTIKSGPYKVIEKENCKTLTVVPHIFSSFHIINTGIGTSINLQINIYKIRI